MLELCQVTWMLFANFGLVTFITPDLVLCSIVKAQCILSFSLRTFNVSY